MFVVSCSLSRLFLQCEGSSATAAPQLLAAFDQHFRIFQKYPSPNLSVNRDDDTGGLRPWQVVRLVCPNDQPKAVKWPSLRGRVLSISIERMADSVGGVVELSKISETDLIFRDLSPIMALQQKP